MNKIKTFLSLVTAGRDKQTKMKNVIQGDCPCCPYADLYGGYCAYYRFFPANINFGEATCRCENLKPRKEEEQ